MEAKQCSVMQCERTGIDIQCSSAMTLSHWCAGAGLRVVLTVYWVRKSGRYCDCTLVDRGQGTDKHPHAFGNESTPDIPRRLSTIR